MGKRYEERIRRGKLQKRCFGKLHNGQWMNVTSFRARKLAKYGKRKDGSTAYRTECRACEIARRNNPENPRTITGYVLVDKYRPFILEIRHRLGSKEAARRIGIGETTWSKWCNGSRKYAQRQSIAQLLNALREARLNNEVRHKTSIKRGAALRGEPELKPVEKKDFYKPTGDLDNERRSKYHSEHLEQELLNDRIRRRRKREADKAASS